MSKDSWLDKGDVEAAVLQLVTALRLPEEARAETAERVARAYAEMLSGYDQDASCLDRTFSIEDDEHLEEDHGIVVLRHIEFFSMCEHHLLPFSGHAHVAYLPRHKVVGLSKLARIVDVYARRLQLQERLGWQIASALDSRLNTRGVAVVLEAQHQCLACRGARRPSARMLTSHMTGVFRQDPAARAEVMELFKGLE